MIVSYVVRNSSTVNNSPDFAAIVSSDFGETWSPETLILASSNNRSSIWSVAVNGSYVVMFNNQSGTLHIITLNGFYGSWSTPLPIASNYSYSSYCDIACQKDDELYCIVCTKAENPPALTVAALVLRRLDI